MVNIRETICEDELVEQILVALLENYETLVDMLIYGIKLPNLNGIIGILFHDESKKEIHRDKGWKGINLKPKRSCNFCRNQNHWMWNCIQLLNKIKQRATKHDWKQMHQKATMNLLESRSKKEINNFQDHQFNWTTTSHKHLRAQPCWAE